MTGKMGYRQNGRQTGTKRRINREGTKKLPKNRQVGWLAGKKRSIERKIDKQIDRDRWINRKDTKAKMSTNRKLDRQTDRWRDREEGTKTNTAQR